MFVYEIENLKCSYKKKSALEVRELKVPQGGITNLVGPNGSGKSTLLRILAFLQPFEGTLKFFGNDNPTKVQRQSVTLLLQDSFLLRRSVFENVAYGLKLRKISMVEIRSIVDKSLLSVGLNPQEFSERQWYALSGGEAQRVALAARLALNPKVLLLDEPTASIDKNSSEAITKVLLHARDEGTAIIIASHDYEWLEGLNSDRKNVTISLPLS